MSNGESLEQDRAALRRMLIMGSSRRPVEVPDWLAGRNVKADRLALVAALGLRGRFDRPTLPMRLAPAGFAHDPARLMGQGARTALRRLFGARKRPPGRAVILRIIDMLAERGLCLHPFDYLAVGELFATADGAIDRNARLWHALTHGDGSATPADDIDDASWTGYRPAQRVAYLRMRRRQDPDAARDLLAAVIPTETAAIRGQLLEAMATGLGAADVEFLRGLAGDRAESVRVVARGLVARIAGTSEFEARMATVHEQLQLKGAGLIGLRKVLMPKLPRGLPEAKTRGWLHDTFSGVSNERLAERLQLSPAAFVAALSGGPLGTIFLANAIALEEHATALAIAAALEPDDARHFVAGSREALSVLETTRRAAFWDAFGAALASGGLAQRCAFAGELYETLRLPPPRSVIEPARAAGSWKQWLEDSGNTPDEDKSTMLQLLIAIAGRTERQAWRQHFGGLPPAATSAALALADLLDALDLQSPTAN